MPTITKRTTTVSSTWRSTSTSETLTTADRNAFISVDSSGAAKTITLAAPATFGAGYTVTIKRQGANQVTVSSSANIDGSSTFILATNLDAVTISCTGTTYEVV